jgi:hypothetical protein
MIAAAINSIGSQLNQFLRRSFGVAEDLVVVSNLTEADGSLVPQVSNKLVLFLVNIEKDSLPGQSQTYGGTGAARMSISPPPVHLNLLLMFAATFSGANYPEALKFISQTIGFFQSRPVIDHQNTPDLDPRIDKLMLDIENLNTAELSNLWGILRGTYMPSILYRMRMVTIDSGQWTTQVPAVLRPQVGLNL